MELAFIVVVLLFTGAVVALVVRVNTLITMVRVMQERVGQLWVWAGKDYSASEPVATGDIGSTAFAAGEKTPRWRTGHSQDRK